MNDLNLSACQWAAIKELQKRMSAVCKQDLRDFTYYRFLKARDFDVDHAESMLKKNLEWRKNNEVDTIHTDYKLPELLQEYLGHYMIANDKEGCPVIYLPVSKIDFKGLFSAVTIGHVMKMFIKLTDTSERLVEEQSKKLNKNLSGFVTILDVEEFPFSLATSKAYINFTIWFVKVLQDNFPERMKSIYIINSSSFFLLLYAIVKRFMATALVSKVQFFGTDGWEEELLKIIDADQLPAPLGGKRTDPDGNPLCRTIMIQGGKIDEKHRLPKNRKTLENSPGVQKLKLSRTTFMEIPVEIEEPGSFIEWEFETKVSDIGFGVFYRESCGKEMKMNYAKRRTSSITELVSLQKMNTDEFTETGMYQCEKPGTYVLMFDNSYSLVRSKEIYYKITVISEKKHDENVENYAK